MPLPSGVPPARVSRVVLLILVAIGALISVATTGALSHFAGGFAVGAGAALVASRLGSAPNGGAGQSKEGVS